MSASETKVHRVEDCKLCADMNPRHEWLLPLAGKATGQPLLACIVLTVKNTYNETHESCQGGTKFLGSRAVLALLGGCGTVGNGFPGEVGLDIAGCVGINNVVIEKCHPTILPDPPNHPVHLELRSTLLVVFRNKDGFH